MVPLVESIRRRSIRIRVDFPLPDKPIITKNSPSLTVKDTSRTAITHPVVSSKLFLVADRSSELRISLAFLPKIFHNPFTSKQTSAPWFLEWLFFSFHILIMVRLPQPFSLHLRAPIHAINPCSSLKTRGRRLPYPPSFLPYTPRTCWP